MNPRSSSCVIAAAGGSKIEGIQLIGGSKNNYKLGGSGDDRRDVFNQAWVLKFDKYEDAL